MAGNLKPAITWFDVFNVISYLEQLRLPRNCFWLPCQKTDISVPHHITHQHLVMKGRAESLHRKMAAKIGLPPGQRAQRAVWFWSTSFMRKHETNRNIKCTVLLGCTYTKNWFLEYFWSTWSSEYWASTLYGTILPLKWAPVSIQSTALEQMRKDKHLS